MKLKSFYLLIIIGLSLTTTAFSNSLNPDNRPITANDNVRAQELTNRLNEISTMNIKEMSRSEKKELRKEVKSIKKEMKTMGGGVYISVGALLVIIIILLLI